MSATTTLDIPQPASCSALSSASLSPLSFAGLTGESTPLSFACDGLTGESTSCTLQTVIVPWRVSERVRELLAVPQRWKVIQRFNQGILLVTTDEDEVLFIGSDETSAGPFNIQIPLAGLQQLKNCGNYAVCDGSGSLFMDRFCLITRAVCGYSTTAPNLNQKQQRFLLAQLSAYLKTCTEQSGFNQFFGEVPPAALYSLLRPIYLSRGLRGFTSFLLGRGLGLTPSGDDFLVGMLAVMSQQSLANQVLQQAQCKNATGVVSRGFFNAAAQRHFNEDICLMLHAAINSDAARLLRLFDRIKKQGHSSGLDLLAGVQFGLCM